MTEEVELPDGYAELLAQATAEVRSAQLRAHLAANTELLRLRWRIGRLILDRQAAHGWGSKVIDRLASDLQAEFPGQRGWSRATLHYMRKLAERWPTEDTFVQHPAGQMPWTSVTTLLDGCADRAISDWYAARAVTEGWSRAVLADRIKGQLHLREGSAPSNFAAVLADPDSELAQQLTKDPYTLDFLGLSGQIAERDLETSIIDNLQRFLLELGTGFAFVGRQYRFEVEGDEFVIDLLFFNYVQNRFVVIELKVEPFNPAHTGQLGFYVAWTDGNLRQSHHAPTIGILICAGRNESVVRYSLASTAAPLAVSDYTYSQLPTDALPAVPDAEALSEVVEHPVVDGRQLTIAEYLDEFGTGSDATES